VPPLRERKGDVELLAYYFLDRSCAANGKQIKSIAEGVMEVLEAHDFPGNLRELENIIASAVVLETGEVLGLHSLPRELRAASRAGVAPQGVRRTLADMEAEHIRAVMGYTSGNRSAAARILGISRMGLLSKLKRLGLEGEPQPGGNGRPPANGH
jgi:DNA-binding NtrC family response regulator